MRRTKVPTKYERLRVLYPYWHHKQSMQLDPWDEQRCSMHLWASAYADGWGSADAHSRNKDIRRCARHKWEPCVYFLLNRGTVLYIGSTVCVKQRVKQHWRDGKRFDEVRVLSKKQYRQMESRLINLFCPPLNSTGNSKTMNPNQKAKNTG